METNITLVGKANQYENQLIADWYFKEWQIQQSKTIDKLDGLNIEKKECQLLMYFKGSPIATGGIYEHVGIHNVLPALKAHKHWLAQVYTVPELRGKGYGSLICREIEKRAIGNGVQKLHLFTHTAENLYRRLNWQVIERVKIADKNIVIMNKDLI